jgi:hypothetical protein
MRDLRCQIQPRLSDHKKTCLPVQERNSGNRKDGLRAGQSGENFSWIPGLCGQNGYNVS